jgi:hypothetical protein
MSTPRLPHRTVIFVSLVLAYPRATLANYNREREAEALAETPEYFSNAKMISKQKQNARSFRCRKVSKYCESSGWPIWGRRCILTEAEEARSIIRLRLYLLALQMPRSLLGCFQYWSINVKSS